MEASRIWDDGLADSKLDQNWSDAEDFAEELAVATKRSPQTTEMFHLTSGSER